MIRPEVEAFVGLGPLPSAKEAGAEQLDQLEAAFGKIVPPVSREEAVRLATVFGQDDCFEFVWSVIHLIETASVVALDDMPLSTNEWILTLRARAKRGNIRQSVRRVLELGPLPVEAGAEPRIVDELRRAIAQLEKPLSRIEARSLTTMFGPDECFGLARELVELIALPLDAIPDYDNPWLAVLRARSTPG